MDPVLNPPYPGYVPPPTDIWDRECNQEITLTYGNETELLELAHNVKERKLCLITINNLSGKNLNITIDTSSEEYDDLRMFRLDNTDEIWWKSITEMEKGLAEQS